MLREFLSLNLARRPASLASGSACFGIHASLRYARRSRNSRSIARARHDEAAALTTRADQGNWTRCLPARHQASAARQSAGKYVGRLPDLKVVGKWW